MNTSNAPAKSKHLCGHRRQPCQRIRQPLPELFRKQGKEVLLLNRIDEWLVSHLREYKVKIVDIAKGDVDVEKLSSKDAKAQEKARSQRSA